MSTVDEIMHGGEYIDRRGRRWCNLVDLKWDADAAVMRTTKIGWCRMRGLTKYDPPISGTHMRLLIERDQHRDVCPRVGVCRNHPVPRVTFCDVGGFDVWAAGELTRAEFARPCIATLAEAMDAARALAVRGV